MRLNKHAARAGPHDHHGHRDHRDDRTPTVARSPTSGNTGTAGAGTAGATGARRARRAARHRGHGRRDGYGWRAGQHRGRGHGRRDWYGWRDAPRHRRRGRRRRRWHGRHDRHGWSRAPAGTAGTGACPAGVKGHCNADTGLPTKYAGYTLALAEEFDTPLDLDSDPIWTWSDGGRPEGQTRFAKSQITFAGGQMIITALGPNRPEQRLVR